MLMLVHPQNLPDKTLFAIDQFVLKGGKAMVFVDPYSEMQVAAMPRQAPDTPTDSNLDKLFKKWGVKLVAGHRGGRPPRRAPGRGAGGRAAASRRWTTSPGSTCAAPILNREDVITADLKQVAMATCRHARTGRGRHDQIRAADHDLAGIDEDPGR